MSEPTKQPNILIMAAGTGGHVFPAMAVAHELQKTGAIVHWLGTLKGMENDLLAKTDFIYHAIDMQGLRGNGIKRLLQAPTTLLKATLACVKIIQANQIDIVVGFGGYVTAPGGLAVKFCQKPLVIHEQNAIAGMSNRYLAKMAKKVLQAFPNTFNEIDQTKVITVGNPVRANIVKLPTPNERIKLTDNSPLRLLVVGGSLGSQALNNNIAPTLQKLESMGKIWQVYHQCGKNNLEDTNKVYQKVDLKQTQVEISQFIDDMATAYAWADVIVCRAGALTVSEIASVGIGAIFVPLPHAVDDHQTANAKSLTDKGAGILLPQSELSGAKLAEILNNLDREACLTMAKKAQENAKHDVAKTVAQMVLASVKK